MGCLAGFISIEKALFAKRIDIQVPIAAARQ
jgi:hypothetical protein